MGPGSKRYKKRSSNNFQTGELLDPSLSRATIITHFERVARGEGWQDLSADKQDVKAAALEDDDADVIEDEK